MSDFYDNLVQKNTTKAVAVKTKEVNPKDLEVCPDNELTLSEIIAENKALKEKISLAVAKAPVKKAPRKAKEKAHDTAKPFSPAKEKKSFLKEVDTEPNGKLMYALRTCLHKAQKIGAIEPLNEGLTFPSNELVLQLVGNSHNKASQTLTELNKLTGYGKK